MKRFLKLCYHGHLWSSEIKHHKSKLRTKVQAIIVNYLDFGSRCGSVESHNVKRENETAKTTKKRTQTATAEAVEREKNRNKDDSDTDGDNKQVCTSVNDATDQHLYRHRHPPRYLKSRSSCELIHLPLCTHSCSHALAAHIWPRCALLYGLLPFFMSAFICSIRSRQEGKMRGREGRACKKRSRDTQKHTVFPASCCLVF